jgi:hypothetical protein
MWVSKLGVINFTPFFKINLVVSKINTIFAFNNVFFSSNTLNNFNLVASKSIALTAFILYGLTLYNPCNVLYLLFACVVQKQLFVNS